MSGEPTSNAGFELRDPVQSGEARPAEQSVADPSGVAPASKIHTYWSGPQADSRASRKRLATDSSDSGTTRTPATADMKFTSPDHLGTT
jgi:hypothetical protein